MEIEQRVHDPRARALSGGSSSRRSCRLTCALTGWRLVDRDGDRRRRRRRRGVHVVGSGARGAEPIGDVPAGRHAAGRRECAPDAGWDDRAGSAIEPLDLPHEDACPTRSAPGSLFGLRWSLAGPSRQRRRRDRCTWARADLRPGVIELRLESAWRWSSSSGCAASEGDADHSTLTTVGGWPLDLRQPPDRRRASRPATTAVEEVRHGRTADAPRRAVAQRCHPSRVGQWTALDLDRRCRRARASASHEVVRYAELSPRAPISFPPWLPRSWSSRRRRQLTRRRRPPSARDAPPVAAGPQRRRCLQRVRPSSGSTGWNPPI